MTVTIIGGGAAGFFSAIAVKENYPQSKVVILEKSNKTLSKVKVSGGGRCNVTHACFSISELVKNYPRGARFLKKAFYQFNPNHTVEWFNQRGVELKTEADGRMFPKSNSSQTIVDCLRHGAIDLGVKIKQQSAVKHIEINSSDSGKFKICLENDVIFADRVIVATGGSPKLVGFDWLKELGHTIESPVPSLFTFNMPNETITDLMGLVAPCAVVKVEGTKLVSEGPILITHWGMSGPAILRCSAFGARVLAEKKYAFNVLVNWLGLTNEELVRTEIKHQLTNQSKAEIQNLKLPQIPKRLWLYLLNRAGILERKVCAELSKKEINRLVNTLFNDCYSVKGKTTFKEEFVTCGGISLSEVNPNTMQSKKVPGLYFAGEVLDIDGVTGGFNFQAAWTTGFIAGRLAN